MVSRCSCDLSHSADRFVHACFFISPLFLSNMASSARALDPLAVTRDNFEEHFHHISSFLLPRTRFISFDTELTGIRGDPSSAVSPLDSSEDRYSKMRSVASRFALIQVITLT